MPTSSKTASESLLGLLVIVGIIYGIFFWYPAHERAVHLAEGWIDPKGWDCPSHHPIKANLKSMIYHLPSDPYWNRTDAMNGECFDTPAHAVEQGFRAIISDN
ncbi:hypothetical protein BH11PAT2_BH11PAT2_04890 [soil metagenome]